APYRVIADHARALAFMIADGILPSNDGRGYVERRLLRRAARFGRELGLERPFLHQVAQTVVDLMGHQYPELVEKRLQIEKIILTEEERFRSTLARGMDLLEGIFAGVEKSGTKVVPGRDLFRLHDTYGFPLDLATDIATDRGFRVDREGFDAAMAQQREQARSAWAGSGEEALAPVYRHVREEVRDTEFVGYDTMQSSARILALIRDGRRQDSLSEGEEGELILDRTPFYAEAGGQVGDVGTLESVEGSGHVSSTKAPVGRMAVHYARVMRGRFSIGDAVTAQVDRDAREATQNHHTATHLLQAALRDILGDHVHQAGSLVAPDRLRFDFTHFEAIDHQRLQDIERKVNQFIRTDAPVSIRFMPLAEARAAGAMALFGEKYADTVRVVQVDDISKELCGGTHVSRTGVIGYFKILSESSISAGVRRIEALCGEPCVEALQGRERGLTGVAQLLNSGVDDLEARVRTLIDENKRLTKEVAKWKQAVATGSSVDYMAKVQDIDGVKLLATEVADQDAPGLRLVLDKLREKLPSGVLILGSVSEGKVALCAGVSKDLAARIKAGDIVKQLAPVVGGGGGGRADMAQAGGKFPDKLPEVISKAPALVKSLLA
ncbi:MAG: alanine--tRNA ligase, partial [Candidatus Hydrogenedentes bacterium]|nr:alanine--tRNA ligase [Candidatus Hydrogenedentota bacterium]